MGTVRRTTCWTVCAVACMMGSAAPAADQNLGEILRDTGWDRLIGTWVDPLTRGDVYRTTYAWKFENTLVEATTKEIGKESVALMGVNGATGDVYHVGADSVGASSIGKWKLEDDSAELEFAFTSSEGVLGTITMRLRFRNANTLSVTIDMPRPLQPIVLELVRAND